MSLHEKPLDVLSLSSPYHFGQYHPRLPTMDSFDAMSMFPMSVGTMMPPMDNNDAFAGSSDYHSTTTLPPRPQLHRATTSTYDDLFSDIQSTYDQTSLIDTSHHPQQHHHQHQHQLQDRESPSLEGDDSKLLSFSKPTYDYALLDYTYRRAQIQLQSQLHGMFFLAETPSAGIDELPAATPCELTCYRRNLFSISGSIQIPRNLRYILNEQGEQIPIVGHELVLSASESVEGNPVKIISVPWKTPAGAPTTSDERPEKEPAAIPIDLMAGADLDPETANIPIAWKRLQFRIATANNGRRKELQQHFVIKIRVMASLSTGQRLSVTEVNSTNIIVRGRSPRNFQAKKEVPVGNNSVAGRKHHQKATPPEPTPVKSEPVHNFVFDPSDMQLSHNLQDWKMPDQSNRSAMTALPSDTFAMPPGVNLYAQSSPGFTKRPSPRIAAPAPINLSLVEDEPRRSQSSSARPRKAPRVSSASVTGPPAAFSVRSLADHDESAGQLYEYFPLGIDDWQEPVDAVYRPHLVHHINVPESKASMASKDRSKRYFSSKEQA